MDLQRIVQFTLQASIFLAVFGFGLQSRRDDLLYPLRRPAALARALAAMCVLMPLVAIGLCAAVDLHPAVAIALVALAISPMPPLLTNREVHAGGRVAYGIGLMTIAAVLSIPFIPLAVRLIGLALGLTFAMDAAALVGLVLMSVVLPLGLGILGRVIAPRLAERLHGPARRASLAGLALSVAAIVATMLPAALSLVGNGTLLVFVVFVTVGILAGHALGGPIREERVVLALSTACRHPAIAIAVARANFPDEPLVPAAVLLYLLVNVAVSVVYVIHQRRARVAADAAHA
jgi:BASS family bile acid:Na+ symporter